MGKLYEAKEKGTYTVAELRAGMGPQRARKLRAGSLRI